MWNLVMGAVFSSDSETEEEEEHQNEVKNITDQVHKTPSMAQIHKEKLRLPSPTRESGDGSDFAHPPHLQQPKLAECGENAQDDVKVEKKMITLPNINIQMEKLPPIKDEVELARTIPTSPLVLIPLSQPCRKNVLKKEKEPKFVPYEPYKAAVTPLEAPRGNDKTKKKFRQSVSTPLLSKQTSVQEEKPNEIAPESREKSEEAEIISNPELQEEIRRLKQQLEEKDKQLRIQTQVNSEVKRLLVASVGEDIEAKVDFLTQDKARLSADIRHYASKISRDFEEKEQLSVESNLWKSKFLACSVIVDELARWKANLLHRSDKYEHTTRLLLHEHSVLWTTLQEYGKVLSNLVEAFDPMHVEGGREQKEAASLLGMVEHNKKLALRLRERLLGQTGIKDKEAKKEKFHKNVLQLDTPAEESLKELLSHPVIDESSEYSELASLAVTESARPYFRKMGDQLQSPQATSFKSCTHCHGVVQNV